MIETPGAVTGGVRSLLGLEGLAVLVLSLLGYLAGSRVGAAAYNAIHTYVGPLVVIAICQGSSPWTAIALISTAHIGMDRSIAFGLKYATGFHSSHLGVVGRSNGG